MNKKLLIGAMLMGVIFTANAQTTLFEDDFESYDEFIITDIGDWTQIDVDGAPTYGIDGYTFENSGYTGTAVVFNPANTTPALDESWTPNSGDQTLNFFAALATNEENPELIGPNDDWFVSPQITLGESGNELSFWAKSITDNWGLERIRVAISTDGNTDPDDFTIISEGDNVQVPIEWTEYTFDLDEFAGEVVYIAINYISDDTFALLVDDFMVTTDAPASVNDLLASKLSVYPNPANNVINLSNAENILVSDVVITDLNGRTVKNVAFDGVASAQINVADLSVGMYMMTISSDKGTMTKKIVKN